MYTQGWYCEYFNLIETLGGQPANTLEESYYTNDLTFQCNPRPPTTLHTHTRYATCSLTNNIYVPSSSALFISFPTCFILELPRQPIMMSQTCNKVSLVAFLFRQRCRNWFCSTPLGVLVTSFKSPSEIISWCSRSYTMALALMSAMKRCLNMSRTCSTVSMERKE